LGGNGDLDSGVLLGKGAGERRLGDGVSGEEETGVRANSDSKALSFSRLSSSEDRVARESAPERRFAALLKKPIRSSIQNHLTSVEDEKQWIK